MKTTTLKIRFDSIDYIERPYWKYTQEEFFEKICDVANKIHESSRNSNNFTIYCGIDTANAIQADMYATQVAYRGFNKKRK